VNLFCSYNVISTLLTKFSLVVKHGKSEVFHFSRSHRNFNPPPLDLLHLGGPTLMPKDTWQYLGFYFNQKLLFHHHIDFYANKAILTIKCMKMLGNLTRRLNKDDCTGVVHYLLHYMDFNCSTITKYYLTILSKVSEKYKKGQPYG